VGLLLKELTQNTVAIGGKIQSFEVVWWKFFFLE
jgi:hypothetical protein